MREEKRGQKKAGGPSRERDPEQKKGGETRNQEERVSDGKRKLPNGKVVAGALSLVILAGGSAMLWKEYQAGALFHPEYFLSRQELRGNQISFADSDRYAKNNLPEKDSSDNEMLEKDPQAKDKSGQEMQDISPRVTMDEQKKETGNPGNLLLEQMPDYADANTSDKTLSDLGNSGAMMLVAGEDGDAQTERVSVANAGGVPDGRNENEKPLEPSDTAAVNGKTDSGRENGSGGSGGNFGGGGETGGADTPGEKPSTPSSPDTPGPSNPDTPSPAPTPDNNPTEGKDSELSDPDYPDKSEKPQLPKDPSFSGDTALYPSFPNSGISSDEKAQNARLILVPCIDDSAETLYQGAVLTKWKLLCSLYAYVDVGGTRYRLTDYSDNFRIGEFPETATKDMTVKFYFRGNANCPWQEVSYTFPVEYSKIVVMGMPSEDGDREMFTELYVDKGDEIYLPNLTMRLAGSEGWESGGDWMTELFPQWSLTEGGEDMGSYLKIEHPGRYVIYPLSRTSLPSGFFGTFEVNEDRTTGSLFFEQKLTFWPSKQECLEIPQGIQGVEQSLFFTADDVAETAKIPESVQFLDCPAFEVRKEYQVDEKNRYFTVQDGMLIDRRKNALVGIPLDRESVEVPEDIKTVGLSKQNSIRKITFLSEKPPEIELSYLNGATLIVPESAYAKYLFAWGASLGTNQLVTGGETDPDYDYRDGALFSKDGTKLYQVSRELSGLYFVPDGVETIGTEAFETSEYIDRVFFPDSVRKLESESLSGESLRELLFRSETPPEIQKDTFGEIDSAIARGLCVRVAEGKREAYLEAWGPVLGESQAESLIVEEPFDLKETESGLSYLNLNDGAVLLQAPEDLTSFDDIVAEAGEDVVWKEIGIRAFGECESLETIELPDTIEKIGKEAFIRCKNLQLVSCKTKGEIEVGKNAFPVVKAVAFDALAVKFSDDEENMIRTSCYVNNDCVVSGGKMPDLVNLWGTSYELKEADQSGSFLYGIYEEESYLLSGTTGVSGAITAPDGTTLREIGYYALENCEGDVTLPEESSRGLWFVGPQAFHNSGLRGTVAFSDVLWKIESGAFEGCKGVTQICFDEEAEEADTLWEKEDQKVLQVSERAFAGTSIEEIRFPYTLESLGQYVFYDCPDLEKVIFTGAIPPTLVTFSRGSQYQFGWEETEQEVTMEFEEMAEGCEQDYLDKWKFSLFGYTTKEEMASDMSFDLLMDVMFNWPGEIFGDDGEYTPEFSAYFDDYVDVKVDQKIYETEVFLCKMMGLEEPEEPEWTLPDPDDYLTDQTENLENPEDPAEEILPDKEEPLSPDDQTDQIGDTDGTTGEETGDSGFQEDQKDPEKPDEDKSGNDAENGETGRDETESGSDAADPDAGRKDDPITEDDEKTGEPDDPSDDRKEEGFDEKTDESSDEKPDGEKDKSDDMTEDQTGKEESDKKESDKEASGTEASDAGTSEAESDAVCEMREQ